MGKDISKIDYCGKGILDRFPEIKTNLENEIKLYTSANSIIEFNKAMEEDAYRFIVKGKVLAIDFDGTVVEHDYPRIGKLKPNAKLVINNLHRLGFTIIIWSVRVDVKERDVQRFLKDNEIKYDGINQNNIFYSKLFSKEFDCEPRKIYADLYIDDRGIFWKDDWLKIYNEVCTKFIGHMPELQ